MERRSVCISGFCSGAIFWLASAQVALASEDTRINEVYEMGELFELGIQLSYLLLLLALLGIGSFFVIRQVLVRRELDLSAKELQVSTCNLSLQVGWLLDLTISIPYRVREICSRVQVVIDTQKKKKNSFVLYFTQLPIKSQVHKYFLLSFQLSSGP